VPRTRGKIPVTKYLQNFNTGDVVVVKHEPAIHDGMPHPRFKGITGKILGKQGTAYQVQVKDGDSYKTLIVAAVHLLKVR